MRRTNQEIWSPAEILQVIDRGQVCYVAMCDGDRPYIVAMSYGYRAGSLYLHCAQQGRKLDIAKRNPRVCFEIVVDAQLEPGTNACAFGMHYRSVVGEGEAMVLSHPEERRQALDAIMAHYGATDEQVYSPKALERTLVVRVRVEKLTGKRSSH